jgi:hypothetical protein
MLPIKSQLAEAKTTRFIRLATTWALVSLCAWNMGTTVRTAAMAQIPAARNTSA